MDLQETLGTIGEQVKRVPWWGWVLAAAVLLFLFWGKLPFGGSSSDQGSSTTAPVDTSGGDTSGGDGGTPTPTPTPTPAPLPAPSPTPQPVPGTKPPSPPTSKRTYTVRPGDTLSGIGASNGENWQDIYNRNASIIESTARQHGFADSDHGHWIFPGEVLSL